MVNIRVNERRKLIEYLIDKILEGSKPIIDLCVQIEGEFELDYGGGLSLFKYLALLDHYQYLFENLFIK